MTNTLISIIKDKKNRRSLLEITGGSAIVLAVVMWATFYFQKHLASFIVASVFIFVGFFAYTIFCISLIRTRNITPLLFYRFIFVSPALLMAVISGFTVIYRYFGINDYNQMTTYDRMSCIYFSIITWTTVGYGDFSPTPDSRMYAAAEALLGYIFMGLVIATLIHVASKVSVEPNPEIDTQNKQAGN